MLGMQYGLKEFKFFPAEANGGVKALQAIAGPFGHIRFCPTGGISPANYRDYGAEQRTVHRRFWLVPADALEAGDYDRITTLARSGGRREINHASVNNPVCGNATGFLSLPFDDDRRGGSPRHGLLNRIGDGEGYPGGGYRQSPACRTDAAAGQPRRPTAAGQS